jgi:hypothetical protein
MDDALQAANVLAAVPGPQQVNLPMPLGLEFMLLD